jgi:hypothetical protein
VLLEAVIRFNFWLVVGFGGLFAVVGLFFRSGPSATADRDNLVYADGFQGATIGTLIVVAVAVNYIDDLRSVALLKEQASLIAIYAILGCLQQADRFRRSLKQ